ADPRDVRIACSSSTGVEESRRLGGRVAKSVSTLFVRAPLEVGRVEISACAARVARRTYERCTDRNGAPSLRVSTAAPTIVLSNLAPRTIHARSRSATRRDGDRASDSRRGGDLAQRTSRAVPADARQSALNVADLGDDAQAI